MVRNAVLLPVSVLSVLAAFALPGTRETFTIGASGPVAATASAIAVQLAEHLPAVRFRTAVTPAAEAAEVVHGAPLPGAALALDVQRDADVARDSVVVPLAWRGLVLVAHPHRTATDLSRTQVEALYTGRLRTWNDLGDSVAAPIKLLLHQDGTEREVLGEHLELCADLADAVACADDHRIERLIAGDPFAIGMMSRTAAEAAIADGAPLQILAIDGVRPTPTTMRDGSYPLVQTLHLLLPADCTGTALVLSDFLRSAAGDHVLQSQGFEPLPLD